MSPKVYLDGVHQPHALGFSTRDGWLQRRVIDPRTGKVKADPRTGFVKEVVRGKVEAESPLER